MSFSLGGCEGAISLGVTIVFTLVAPLVAALFTKKN